MIKKKKPDVMTALLNAAVIERTRYNVRVANIAMLAQVLQQHEGSYTLIKALLQKNPDAANTINEIRHEIEEFLTDLILQIQTQKRLGATVGGN